MRPWRGVLLTLFLAIVAAIGGTWIGSRYVSERARPSPSLHALIHEQISLSAEQERRIEVLEREFAQRRKAREAELRAANAELAAAIQARHEYSPEVQAAVEHFHHAMGELQKETIVHVLSMRKVLTPEQATKFDRLVARALTQESP